MRDKDKVLRSQSYHDWAGKGLSGKRDSVQTCRGFWETDGIENRSGPPACFSSKRSKGEGTVLRGRSGGGGGRLAALGVISAHCTEVAPKSPCAVNYAHEEQWRKEASALDLLTQATFPLPSIRISFSTWFHRHSPKHLQSSPFLPQRPLTRRHQMWYDSMDSPLPTLFLTKPGQTRPTGSGTKYITLLCFWDFIVVTQQ